MAGFGGKGKKDRATPVSADFQRALTQEVMATELLRIKVLIATAAVLGITVGIVYFLIPETVNRVWRGNLTPLYLYSIIVPFMLFEWWVIGAIKRHMRRGLDLPLFRRYLGALIETSMPTVALVLHIDSMGSVAALGFVAPMIYFIFIILSTLRLDFWLSTFTGAVAATQLFCMAMFYHPAGEAEPSLFYHAARSLIVLVCGVLAGAVGHQLRRQFEASIMAATARDRITNLFGQAAVAQVVEHLMAECTTTREGKTVYHSLVLNEAAVLAGPPFTMVDVQLYVDGELVTTYSCDGLIVSTPVGSTAHSLSAGGPILRNDIQAFVILPINPHTLTHRPVVDSADRTIELAVPEPLEGTSLVVDGKVLGKIEAADRIKIVRSKATFRMVEVRGHTYYRTLHDKLGWSGQIKTTK